MTRNFQNPEEEIFELTTEAQWRDALAVLQELRPELDVAAVIKNRESLMDRGYKLYGLSSSGKFLCVAGIVIHPHITRENEFWVHDLVTVAEARSKGCGETMMRFLEKEAKKAGCDRLMVHTRTSRDRAQNFYENRLGYDQYAIVFQKTLN